MKSASDPLILGGRLDQRIVGRLKALVTTIGTCVLLTGGMVLGGYAFRLPILTTVHPGLQAMSVVTASALSFLAAALLASQFRHRRLSRYLNYGVLALATAILGSHAVYQEDVFSRPLAEVVFGYAPELAGRSSIATATVLALIAVALRLKTGIRLRRPALADTFGGFGLLIAGMAVVSYLYGVQDLYTLKPFNTIALHTSIALFLLALGTILVDPEQGWAATIASDELGGAPTRRQLLFTLLIPVAGALLLQATDADAVGPNLAMALLVVLTASSLALLILRDGRTQSALDAARRAHAAVLAKAKAEVDAQLEARLAELTAETQERLRVEEALRQAQKLEAIGQLTGGVAHDFNNLLTVIRSSIDLLARPELPEERRRRYVTAISDTVTRAAKLTGQLLAFARRQSLKPEVFEAGQAVKALGDMIQTVTGSRIGVETLIPEAPWFINVDPSQFDTALINMIVNARDAMNGEGQLAITLQPAAEIPPVRSHAVRPGTFVVVSIGDTGTGMTPEVMQQIFEPFFTTKGVGHGTGLGLSQVFGFAKQSGGDVRVESEVGNGTTFYLYLPRVTAEVQAAQSEEEPLIDGHGTCVLLVEDNVDVGTFASQTLADLGYVTTWASDAEEALSILAKRHAEFDVVFSDVVMPGMNGIELGQEIRRRYADLPVVLTSGYSHVLAQNGTYGFELLHKPYSIEELSRILRKAAQWQRRRRLLTR